jgi:hypothetical protein
VRDQVSQPHKQYTQLHSRTFHCLYFYTANEHTTDSVHVYTRAHAHTNTGHPRQNNIPVALRFPVSQHRPTLQHNRPRRNKRFSLPLNVQTAASGAQRILGSGGCLSWAIKLTSHLHTEPSLRTSGTRPPLSLLSKDNFTTDLIKTLTAKQRRKVWCSC